MKDKKGFTLVELLAVIVVLAILLTIAVGSVTNAINKTKEATKYAAAKEIVAIAEAYMEENNIKVVTINILMTNGYLESDVTNPVTGDNSWTSSDKSQYIVKNPTASSNDTIKDSYYNFDGYTYVKDYTVNLNDVIDEEDIVNNICNEGYKFNQGTCVEED